MTRSSRRRALFLDRDGVLNEPVWDELAGAAESPLRVEDVRLTPGAADAVARAKAAGLLTVIVSNQPSAAKGRVPVSALQDVQDRVLELLSRHQAVVDASYLCLHHPDGTQPQLAGRCDCRKPAPGLLIQASRALGIDLHRSWMIGDTDADVGAARAAGLAGVVVVEHPLSAHRRSVTTGADAVAADIGAAVDLVLNRADICR